MRVGRALLAVMTVALLAGGPSAAWAEGDDPMSDTPPDAASLSCSIEPLPARGFELNVARLTCEVAGAPVTDAHFTASLARADTPRISVRPLCSADLQDGAGACTVLT